MATKPSAWLKHQIDVCIRALKQANVWGTFDALYFFAIHDATAALLNAKTPGSYTLTLTGAPVFAQLRGYSGFGANNLTGPNLATFGGGYALNNAHMGVMCVVDTTNTNGDIGSTTNSIRAHLAGDIIRTRANDGVTTDTALSPATARGHSMWSRSDAAGYTLTKNGVDIATPATASTSITSGAIIVAGSSRVCSVAHFGTAMTAAQRSACAAAIIAFSTSVGAYF